MLSTCNWVNLSNNATRNFAKNVSRFIIVRNSYSCYRNPNYTAIQISLFQIAIYLILILNSLFSLHYYYTHHMDLSLGYQSF